MHKFTGHVMAANIKVGDIINRGFYFNGKPEEVTNITRMGEFVKIEFDNFDGDLLCSTERHVFNRYESMSMTPEAITAQVACEAVASNPTAYTADEVDAVIHTATYAGVGGSYLEALKAIRARAWRIEAS